MLGGEGVLACAQCRQVKAKCSLVNRHNFASVTLARACKQPWIGEAGLSRGGGAQERVEEVADEEPWGVKACKAITHLNGNLIVLAKAARQHNELLGCLVGMMEEERMMATWRWRRQGMQEVAPVMVLSEDNADEEVRARSKEGGKEELE